jgi:c-di-GMP-binding flagellar brake protein YcgR
MLRRWFNRQRSKPQPADAGALREVYLNLFDVQRSHALIDVTIDGIEARYQSIILGVDPEAGTVTIDELFPRDFVGLPGQPVSITVRLAGSRRLTFASRIVERRRDAEGTVLYQLALPETLDYNQRRGAFRLKLGQGWAVASEFVTPDASRCAATVRDLSSTGIRLQVRNTAPLNEGDVLQNLQFEFAGRSFQCRADVRSVRDDGEQGTVIGAAFLDLPRVEQRSLERMIMQLQRQQAQEVIGTTG